MSQCCCQANCLCLPQSPPPKPVNLPSNGTSSGLVIPLVGIKPSVIIPYTGTSQTISPSTVQPTSVLTGIAQLPKCSPLPSVTGFRGQLWNHSGRVGLHVGLQKSLLETVQQAGTVGARCCQIFLGSELSYNIRSLSTEDLAFTQQYLLNQQNSLYVHAPLVTQLGGKIGESNLQKSMQVLVDELDSLRDLPASVVVHMGKGNHGCTIEQMGQVVNHLGLTKGYYASNPYRLLLENDAGQGSSLIRSVEDLRRFYEVLDRTVIGLCLDTQHCFAGGQVQWSDHDTIGYLEAVASAVGKDQIGLIHLNDSKTQFGSRHDKHANLGEGHIWSRDNIGFRRLMDWVIQTDTDVVLETENGYAESAHLNKMIVEGQ